MGELRFHITMSLDGYIAGPNQSERDPLREGGGNLHGWAFATRSFRAMHGREGGETGPDDEVAAEWVAGVGATIMGRNMFGPLRGEWGEPAWRGWWGEEPPFRTPVFVLTHHLRPALELAGGTTFHFVTDSIEAALEQAREAAGGQDVQIAGGAEVARQYLRAGLVDRMEIHLVPALLGGGSRLFEDLGGVESRYEVSRVVATPAATHVAYRRVG